MKPEVLNDARRLRVVICTLLLMVPLLGCEQTSLARLGVNTPPSKKLVFAHYNSDGVCSASARRAEEAPFEYVARMSDERKPLVFVLDIDCLAQEYSKEELQYYASSDDYSAIYALNASLIDWNVQAYCKGELKLYGNEKIDYDGRVKFRDFVPDYYLYLARLKSRECGDKVGAYDYYKAAEMTGALVPVSEKGAM